MTTAFCHQQFCIDMLCQIAMPRHFTKSIFIIGQQKAYSVLFSNCSLQKAKCQLPYNIHVPEQQ